MGPDLLACGSPFNARGPTCVRPSDQNVPSWDPKEPSGGSSWLIPCRSAPPNRRAGGLARPLLPLPGMSRLASRLSIPLTLALGACAASGGAGDFEDEPEPRSTELRVLVDNEGIHLIDGVEAMGTPRTVVGGPTLRYEFRAEDGRLLEAGHVPDPRALRSEWVAAGTYEQLDVSAMSGIANVTVPHGHGQLTLFQVGSQGEREIGRLRYAPGQYGTARHAVMDSSSLVGGPVQLPGGDAPGRKLNVLVVGDGYLEEELPAYREAVDEMIATFRATQAIAPYSSRIRFWRQDVRSKESGIDVPMKGQSKETAFDVSYGTTKADARCTWFATTKAQVSAKKLGESVSADVVVVVANDTGHGGCAGGTVVVQTLSDDAGLVLAHELGHAVFGLADEYEYGSCDLAAKAPNISRSAKLEDLPWKSLVTAKALPTPETESQSVVGAFEGAAYCPSGMYRPQATCMMREVHKPFCSVCAHQVEQWFDQSQSGSKGGAKGPTSDTVQCGELTAAGACDGDTLSYCDAGSVRTMDCDSLGARCAWVGGVDDGYYDCVKGDGSPPEEGCGALTGAGQCDGTVLSYCSSEGSKVVVECATSGAGCGWVEASGFYDCVAGSTGEEGGSSGCGSVTWAGVCENNQLRYCQAEEIVEVDCGAQGLECHVQSGQADCAAPSAASGGCEGIAYEGECVGDVLSWCENDDLSTLDCAEGGKTCGWSQQAGYYDCL